MASYDSALALVQPLAAPVRARDTSYQAAQHELILLYGRKGRLLQSLGKLKEAESALASGVAVGLDMAASDPASHKVKRRLAIAYLDLARVYTKAGNTQAFVETSNLAEQQLWATLDHAPDDPEVVNGLAAIYGTRALHLLERDASAESAGFALSGTRKAMAVLQPAYDKAPFDTLLQYNYAVLHNNTGIALLRLQRPREAVKHQRRTVEILAALAAKDESDIKARDGQAQANVWLSESLLAAGEVSEALEAATLAASLFEGLPRGARDRATTQDELGLAYYRIGRALEARAARPGVDAREQRSDMHAACVRYRQSLGPLAARDKRMGPLPGKAGAAAVREALKRCV